MLKHHVTAMAMLLGTTFFVLPSFTSAAQWFNYNSSAYGELLADKESLVKSSDEVRVWTVEAAIKLKPGQPVYSKVLYEINCREHQYQLLQVTAYDRDGQSVDVAEDAKVRNIMPDSREEPIEQFACKSANGWWTPVSHVPESLDERVRDAKKGFFD
jgi:hypothetical protein